MRNLFSKILTGSFVAGAALLVAACGGSETVNTTDANMTDSNMMESMEGTTNDVTAVDATMGSDSNMAMDSNTSAMDSNMSSGGMMESNTSNAM